MSFALGVLNGPLGRAPGCGEGRDGLHVHLHVLLRDLTGADCLGDPD